ncbi:VWA domain-containing protein [Candidatus Latescibacterota bacterium]
MAFNNPEVFWLLLLLPVLLAIGGFLSLVSRRDRRRFANLELYNTLTRSKSKAKQRIRWFLYALGMVFLVLALTEPRFGTKTEILRRMGIDIVIAMDTSYSMLAEDIKPNRIQQAKYEIHRLIDNLKGDRVALLAFAGKSFVQCPLTTDYGAAKTLLDNIDIGIIPEQSTNIGEAIEGSLILLEKGSDADSESQLIILFTDGENLSGNPGSAAKKAASKGIRIFTIGIGTRSGEIIPIRNERGELEDYKKDSKGNVVKTSLDEDTLISIASETNGSYLRTVNGEVDIQEIIDHLGTRHKTDIHERKISRLKERYQLPLGMSLFFLLIWISLGERRSGMLPSRWKEVS